VTDAVSFLTQLLPYTDGKDPSWPDEALDRPALPAVLKTLTGMVSSHLPTQQVPLDHGLIPLLVALEHATSRNSIGGLAVALLEHAMAGPSVCAESIQGLRELRQQDKRARAATRR
jgi:hypothetical protein